jgi:hypothetical protein
MRTPLSAPELKYAPLALARVDAAGTFAGYASLFDREDLGRDVVLRGAFRDSLAARGAAGIRMLFQHDPKEPVGVWQTIREDALGLYVEGRLALDVARAREVHALMRAGALDGLSIGFRTVTGRRDPRTGIRRLAKVDLWEISIVTFPLLPGARIAHVKSRARSLAATIAAATRLLRRSTRPPRRSRTWSGRAAGPLGSFRPPTRKYSPDQPRLPAGQSGGGQWTNGGSNTADPSTEPEGATILVAGGRKRGGIPKALYDWTVRQFVSTYCKASIREELPSDFNDISIKEMLELAQSGDRRAQTCKKLLERSKYRK